MSLSNLPYGSQAWTETHYVTNWQYVWRVTESTARIAATSYTRTLVIPKRSISVIRMNAGSSTVTADSKDLNLIDDAHNAKWQTGTNEYLAWSYYRGMNKNYSLLHNGGLEQGVWNYTNGTVTLDTTQFYSGTKSIKLEGSATTTMSASDPVKVTPRRIIGLICK